MNKKRVAFHTLGCKVNQYETEKLAVKFQELGFEIVADAEPADVYVINSCTVTAIADRKSRNYARRSKRLNPKSLTALVGCYAEVAGDRLADMPEIDLLLGSEEKSQLPERVCALLAARTADGAVQTDSEPPVISETRVDGAPALGWQTGAGNVQADTALPLMRVDGVPAPGWRTGAGNVQANTALPLTRVDGALAPGWQTGAGNVEVDTALPLNRAVRIGGQPADIVPQPVTNRTRAYLKIQDGCDRGCAYCVIPLARGKVRSRPVEAVLAEAKTLIDTGYKEIILTGINTALYGNDFRHYHNQGDGIIDIVNRLDKLPGDFRIRLNSLEPTVIDAVCVKALSAYKRLCAHFHLSLQSGSDRILKAMGRPYQMRDYMEIVEILKTKDPDVAVTADIIVGFPGETQADFEESLKAIQDVGFARIHVFKYSRRPGTAAAEMREQVSEAVKSERSRALISAGEESATAFRARNVGKTRQALFLECGHEGLYTGITDNDLEVSLYSKENLVNRLIDVRL